MPTTRRRITLNIPEPQFAIIEKEAAEKGISIAGLCVQRLIGSQGGKPRKRHWQPGDRTGRSRSSRGTTGGGGESKG